MTGQPIGVRRWPFPGGVMRQPAPVVQAARILLAEFETVRQAREKKTKAPAEAKA
jgi:hypothetical protein